MKKLLTTSILLSSISLFSQTTWTDSGSYSTTSDKIGIGTTNINIAGTGVNDLVIGNGVGSRGLIVNAGPNTGNDAILAFARAGVMQARWQFNGLTGDFFFYRPATGRQLTIKEDGNIGIGTENTTEKLTINGNILFENGDSDLIFGNNAAHIREVANSIEFITHSDFRFYLDENQNSNSNKFQVYGNVVEGTTSSQALFSILETGEVAIGTTDFSGNHKLRVEGSIGAREIKVEATGWSDFVFYNNYDLPSLEEVEKYIVKNNHLPEIPSEAEVLEEGIKLGEMNAKLLQKIEELTLYLIEQNKRINTLEEKLAEKE